MAADWPVPLPQIPLEAGYSEQIPKVIIRTPMGAGPSKTRRYLGTNSRYIDIAMHFTESQIEIFEEFFFDVILGGALEFNWKHPRTQVNIVCRIVADENNSPAYKPHTPELTEVTFKLEVLP